MTIQIQSPGGSPVPATAPQIAQIRTDLGAADAAATAAALAQKADVSSMNSALAGKAEAAATTAALATKADAASTTSALASKADAAATTASLALKANADSPAFTGPVTAGGSQIIPDAPMAALVIDVQSMGNSKTVAANSTFSYLATPVPLSLFRMVLTTGAALTHTFPSFTDGNTLSAATTISFPTAGTYELFFRVNGAGAVTITGHPAAAKPADALTYAQVAAVVPLIPVTSGTDDAQLAALVAAVPAGQSLRVVLAAGATYNFTGDGLSTQRRIVIDGPPTARVNFRPVNSDAVFFTWTGVGANVADQTEEFQLDGPGITGGWTLMGNRVNRANGFRFIKCDNVKIDVRTFGLKGFSLDMQKSRECAGGMLRTRFCGYIDTANAANNVPDIWLRSPAAVSGDTTNYCKFLNVLSIYPFGPAVELLNTTQMDLTNVMVHALAQANTALEANIVIAFGGSAGWTGGVANNEFAALHVNPGGTVANVSGRTFATPMRAATPFYVDGNGLLQSVKFTSGQVVGSQLCQNIWADNGALVDLAQIHCTSVSSTQYAQAISSIASNALTMAGGTLPETGQPCDIANTGGALPTGVTARTTYYLIKLSATTCSLASSRANAFLGTALAVSGGSGTNTLTVREGYNLLATGGSVVRTNKNVQLNDGYQAAFADATSYFAGEISTGTTYAQGPAMPHAGSSQLMYVLRNADMTSTADQAFTKVGGGFRYTVDKIIFKCKSGAFNTACAGGIYSGAGKTGTVLVAAAQSYAGLTGTNARVFATDNTTSDTAASPILSLTTGNAAPLTADVWVYGYPTD